jgi:GntR family transcriptional regulator, rspAB operon transcriptional repressor
MTERVTAALAIDLAHSPEPIARQVARALRQAVVTMRIAPGEMLSEQDIATKFGVSRQPVREAFIKLAEAGLVRVLPQRGTLVVKISRAAVEDARFIREAVECAVAREAARQAGPAAIATLTDSLARQRRAWRARDVDALFGLDEEFHRLLAEIAGRPSAWRIVEDVKPQMDRVRYLDMADAIPMTVVIEQHGAIVEALKARNPKTADAAMRAHLREILRSLPKMAKRYPDMFETSGSGG